MLTGSRFECPDNRAPSPGNSSESFSATAGHYRYIGGGLLSLPHRQNVVPKDVTQHYTLKLFLYSLLLTLSSANFAFDNQAHNQTQAMDAFERAFGDCKPVKG